MDYVPDAHFVLLSHKEQGCFFTFAALPASNGNIKCVELREACDLHNHQRRLGQESASGPRRLGELHNRAGVEAGLSRSQHQFMALRAANARAHEELQKVQIRSATFKAIHIVV